VHDAARVAVCPRWLAGGCAVAGCPLQHRARPELMPICAFFLQARAPVMWPVQGPCLELCRAHARTACARPVSYRHVGADCQLAQGPWLAQGQQTSATAALVCADVCGPQARIRSKCKPPDVGHAAAARRRVPSRASAHGAARQGLCSNAECGYLHVKLGPHARPCQAFLRGYCGAGAACPHMHVTPRMLRVLRASRSLAAPAAPAAQVPSRMQRAHPGPPCRTCLGPPCRVCLAPHRVLLGSRSAVRVPCTLPSCRARAGARRQPSWGLQPASWASGGRAQVAAASSAAAMPAAAGGEAGQGGGQGGLIRRKSQVRPGAPCVARQSLVCAVVQGRRLRVRCHHVRAWALDQQPSLGNPCRGVSHVL